MYDHAGVVPAEKSYAGVRIMNHKLKILSCYFVAVLEGRKTFEIRYDRDRGFQAGDTVLLQEHGKDPVTHAIKYTGRELFAKIGYVTAFEQKPGYVVFSLLGVEGP